MAYTVEQQNKINYLRSSLRLQAPDVETDPAYKFTDDELFAVLETVAPAHSVTHTIDTMPNSEMYFVMLLAKKEIFYRLATSTAPFYPLSAEGAKLEKNVRFDHYLALIKEINKEYEDAMKRFASEDGGDIGVGGEIEVHQVKLWGKPYANRYFSLTDAPTISVELSGITEGSVNVDWTKYSENTGNRFLRYLVFYDTVPIYDEYSISPIPIHVKPDFVVEDIRRTKLRITELMPDTTYYVLVRVDTSLGLSGYAQKEFTTNKLVVTP